MSLSIKCVASIHHGHRLHRNRKPRDKARTVELPPRLQRHRPTFATCSGKTEWRAGRHPFWSIQILGASPSSVPNKVRCDQKQPLLPRILGKVARVQWEINPKKRSQQKSKNRFGKHPARKINENLQIRESFDEFPGVHFQFPGMNPRLISK